jgi:polyisoprenoid-binding protein YceI
MTPAVLAFGAALAPRQRCVETASYSVRRRRSSRVVANGKAAWMVAGLLAFVATPSVSFADAPVFTVGTSGSSVTFHVKASVPLQGRFDKWTSSLTFTSPDVSTGVLDVKVDAGSVNTGSGMKDGTLKSDKFFDVQNNPVISFHSTKISRTGPNTFAVTGDFTIRGVTKPQTVVLTTTRDGSNGEIKGTMSFDRKDYGMTGGVPLVKIADRVEVTVDLKVKRVSGPPVALKPTPSSFRSDD